jgi:WD40 repeat protein
MDLSLGSALSAVAIDHGGTLAVATERGLMILSLDGAGPLTRSVERLPEQSHLSISRDGRFAVLGGPAVVPVPLTVYRRAESDYASLTDFPITAAVWAAAVPGHPGEGGDQLAVWGGVVGDEMSGSLFRLDTPDAPSLLSTAQIDGLTAGDVDPRLRWIVADSVVTGQVHVYDLESGDVVTTLPLPASGEGLTGIRFDPSGGRLLVSSSGGHSVLYDTDTWNPRQVRIVDQHDIAVGYWNDDGSLLATASSNGQITIRDGETFEAIRHMAGPLATLNIGTGGPLIFSTDDSLLLTDHDNVARLWDVGSGQQIGIDMTTSDGTNSGVNAGAELQLVTGTDSRALVWNLDTDSWADVACRAAGSNLTAAEWDQWGPRDEAHRAICEQFPTTPR